MRINANAKILTILVLLLICCTAYAQRVKRVSGTATYVAPGNIGLDEACLIAESRAKLQAIADEFGTIVSRSSITHTQNSDGNAQIDSWTLGESVVKGEWIETISKEFTRSIEQNQLVITCSIKGRAREVNRAKIEFSSKVLCNGTKPQFEKYEFNSGDQLYLSFQTPKNGYVAVYLMDVTNKTVSCLLPYPTDSDGQMPVEQGQQYVFFDRNARVVDDFFVIMDEYPEEYYLYSEDKAEIEQLYVIFSPNPFTKAVNDTHGQNGLESLTIEEFERWLTESLGRDSQMSVDVKTIHVNNLKR